MYVQLVKYALITARPWWVLDGTRQMRDHFKPDIWVFCVECKLKPILLTPIICASHNRARGVGSQIQLRRRRPGVQEGTTGTQFVGFLPAPHPVPSGT